MMDCTSWKSVTATPLSTPVCKICVGTGSREVRLYDTRAQRRAVMTRQWGDGDVYAATATTQNSCIQDLVFAGNSLGGLAGFDPRSSLKPVATFKGCHGSIRSIALHESQQLLAAYGLDRYLHLYSTNSRSAIGAFYTKQHGTEVCFTDVQLREDCQQNRHAELKQASKQGDARVSKRLRGDTSKEDVDDMLSNQMDQEDSEYEDERDHSTNRPSRKIFRQGVL